MRTHRRAGRQSQQDRQSQQNRQTTRRGLTIADASAGEADGVVRFTVSLGVASGAPVTVAYQTEDGRAKAGADYEAASGRLTFAAESTVAQQIEVRLRDDPVDESPETFTVRLSDPQGATLAVTTATGTILDDDTRALAVEPSELYVTEGDTASYEVTLGSEPTAPVTVAVTAGTETGALTVYPDRLTFTADNWTDAQEVTLTAAQDNDALADAPVELTHRASGGGYDGVAGPAVTVTIVEDDVATLAMAAAHASERARRIVFEVTLSKAGDEAVTVDYATTDSSDDTATEGTDYTPTSGTLRFPARSTAARAVEVTVNDDALNEDTETFTVTLRNAANAQLAGGGETLTASGLIEDEDPLPELRIGDGSLTEGSEDGSMRFVVRLDAASGRTVTVRYATANVTATAGRDYTRGERYADVRRGHHGADGHGADNRRRAGRAGQRAVHGHPAGGGERDGKHRTRNRDNRRQRPGTGVEHRGQRTDRGLG